MIKYFLIVIMLLYALINQVCYLLQKVDSIIQNVHSTVSRTIMVDMLSKVKGGLNN